MSESSLTIDESYVPRDSLVARVPFFYGWVILPIAIVAQVASSPGQTFGIAVFNPSFAEELNLTQPQLTGAFGLASLLASVLLPLLGAGMDRWGIRRMFTAVVLLFGGACVLTSQVRGLGTLFLALLLLRMFGQGAMGLMSTNALPMWFHSRLGTVMGIMSVCCVLLMGQLPPLITMLIHTCGWRWAYAIQGLCVWGLMLPLLALAFRNRPEDVGQAPDGHKAPLARRAIGAAAGEVREDFDLGEAIRTPVYWVMILVYAVWSMIGTALVFNVHKLFALRDLSPRSADLAIMTLFTCTAVTNLVGGVLADRMKLSRLLGVAIAGLTTSLGMLVLLPGSCTLVAYAVFGLFQGILGSTGNTLWPRYFGCAHAGKIRGSAFTASVAGSSLGPFIMGFTLSRWGGYEPSLWSFLVLVATLIVPVTFAKPPRRAARPSSHVALDRAA